MNTLEHVLSRLQILLPSIIINFLIIHCMLVAPKYLTTSEKVTLCLNGASIDRSLDCLKSSMMTSKGYPFSHILTRLDYSFLQSKDVSPRVSESRSLLIAMCATSPSPITSSSCFYELSHSYGAVKGFLDHDDALSVCTNITKPDLIDHVIDCVRSLYVSKFDRSYPWLSGHARAICVSNDLESISNMKIKCVEQSYEHYRTTVVAQASYDRWDRWNETIPVELSYIMNVFVNACKHESVNGDVLTCIHTAFTAPINYLSHYDLLRISYTCGHLMTAPPRVAQYDIITQYQSPSHDIPSSIHEPITISPEVAGSCLRTLISMPWNEPIRQTVDLLMLMYPVGIHWDICILTVSHPSLFKCLQIYGSALSPVDIQRCAFIDSPYPSMIWSSRIIREGDIPYPTSPAGDTVITGQSFSVEFIVYNQYAKPVDKVDTISFEIRHIPVNMILDGRVWSQRTFNMTENGKVTFHDLIVPLSGQYDCCVSVMGSHGVDAHVIQSYKLLATHSYHTLCPYIESIIKTSWGRVDSYILNGSVIIPFSRAWLLGPIIDLCLGHIYTSPIVGKVFMLPYGAVALVIDSSHTVNSVPSVVETDSQELVYY